MIARSWKRIATGPGCHMSRFETGRSLAGRCVSLRSSSPPRFRPAHFNGGKAYEYAREFAAIGPRWPTGPGHVKAEAFLRDHFQHDQLEEDTFTADTPIGPVTMRNFIVRFPGQKARRHRARHALRDQLPAAQHQLCGRQRRRRHHRPADGHRRPAAHRRRTARSSTATPCGWSSSTAKKPSRSGPRPTRPTAAAIWPRNGAATERWARSRPSCWPT